MKIGSSTYSRIKENWISSKTYKICANKVFGLSFKLGKKNLVLLKAKWGFIMCGYLNLKACDKFEDAAAIVKGVSNVRELLKAEIVAVSKQAQKLGVRKGMSAREAIIKLS